MSEGIFDPEVYGRSVNTDTQFDTEVYGILGEDQFSGAFGQAQAFILGNTHNAYGQCQADILHTYQAYGQASCDIKQIYQQYAQCQADIKQTYQGYGQCQALIANKYNVYGQSQAYVLQDKVFGQCQAQISRPATPVYGQANAYVTPLRTSATGGNATGASFTLTLNNLQKDDLILLHIGRSNSLISYTLTNDAGLWEDVPARRSLNNNLLDQRNYYVPSGISSVTFTLQASTAVTLQAIGAAYRAGGGLIYNVHVINSNTGSASANLGVGSQTWIKGQELQVATTANSNTQPVTPTTGQGIEVTEISSGVFVLEAQYNGHVTANNDLSASVPVTSSFGTIVEMFVKAVPDNQGYSQAQAQITNSYQAYGQAQGKINAFDVTRYGQAQSDIVTSYQTYGQCQAHIVQTYNGYGQAQSQIINSYQSYSQAQGEINQTYNTYGQSQATIKITGYGVGQSQGEIFKVINAGWGQATADILSSSYKLAHVTANIDSPIKLRWATTQGYIYKDIGYGQAAAFITHHLGPAQAQAQLKRINNKVYAAAQAFMINRKKHGHAMGTIKRTNRSTALATGYIWYGYRQGKGQANAHIYHPIGLGQAVAYITPANGWMFGQAQAYVYGQRAYSQAMADIKVIKNRVYGQAQAFLDYLGRKSFAQATADILVFNTNKFAQARAVIFYINRFGQAQGYIISRDFNRFAQAQGHIIGNTGYGQANADIEATVNKYGQAQGKIFIPSVPYLVDTFTRTIAEGTLTLGSPDVGPPWDLTVFANGGGQGVSVNGSQLQFNNNVPEFVGDDYGWMWAYNPINQSDVNVYAEFKFGDVDNFDTIEFDIREPFNRSQYITFYHFPRFNPADGRFNLVASTGTFAQILFNADVDTWYSIRLQAFGTTARGKVWATGDTEPDWQATISGAGVPTGAGGFAIYMDNGGTLTNTFHYIDNINISDFSVPQYGQANALITNPSPTQFAQAQACITGAFAQAQGQIIAFGVNRYAQAKAFIGNQGRAFGLAMARIPLEFTNNHLDAWGAETNAVNEYQSYLVDNYSYELAAYYFLNEPLLTDFMYTNSDMLYKDVVWDHFNNYHLTRTFGSTGYGPYGNQYKLVPMTYDQAIISSTNSAGFDYLQYNGSIPAQVTGFGYQIMFWFKPLEIRTSGGPVLLLLIGNTTDTGLGAISFKYEPTGLLSVYYGDGATANLILQYSGLVINQTYFVSFLDIGSGGIAFTPYGINDKSFLGINDQIVDTSPQLTAPQNTIFIGGSSSDTYKFVLDELFVYGFGSGTFDFARTQSLYYIGMGFNAGFGNAQAVIVGKLQYGQAQADLRNPWKWAQANARIITHPRKYAQAQANIFGTHVGQAMAFIGNTQPGQFAQAQGYVSTKRNSYGQARATLINSKKHAQAQAVIYQPNTTTSTDGSPVPASYLVSYNGYILPGYAQEESIESSMKIDSIGARYYNIPYSEYKGLENKLISLRMKVVGDSYLECKNEMQLAGTILRTNRAGYSKLYLQFADRYYEAIPSTIKMDTVAEQTTQFEYTVDFEAKPWLTSDTENSISGTGLVTTNGRTINDGGWTPTTITMTGTDITVSGYTSTGDFAGFISVSGFVSGLIIDAETMDTNINGVFRNDDYRIYVGPGVTNFQVTGASSFTLKYRNRWYL